MDDHAVRALAARQHGVISRAQVLALSGNDKAIGRRVRSGQWGRVRRGVFVVGGVPGTWTQGVMAACLAAGSGAAASHRTGLRLWGQVARSGVLEVLVPAPRHLAMPGVRVHQSVHLPRADLTQVDGIPVTTLARTIVDAAPGQSARVVAGWIDEGVRRRHLDLTELADCVGRLGGPGRPGLTVLRTELERRGRSFDPGDSPLEARVILVLREAGLPAPVLQYRVRLDDGSVAYLDLAYPAEMVAIEVDGWLAHGRRGAFTPDRSRRNALTALGWRVFQITADMTDREIIAVVARAVAAQTAGS